MTAPPKLGWLLSADGSGALLNISDPPPYFYILKLTWLFVELNWLTSTSLVGLLNKLIPRAAGVELAVPFAFCGGVEGAFIRPWFASACPPKI